MVWGLNEYEIFKNWPDLIKGVTPEIRIKDTKRLRDKRETISVTFQPNCIINFMGLYACYYLNYFKCIKLWYFDVTKD